MAHYLPQTIATPLTVVRRERLLPEPGEILVSKGERVEPVQVIARTSVSSSFRIINVARQLQVPSSKVSKHLKVEPGEKVKRGQVVAALGGLGGRSCRSTLDGVVTGSGGGRVLIEGYPQEVELRANMYGTVTRIIGGRGVEIRATGALIQGVWGNGEEGTGVLRLLIKERDEVLSAESIDASCRGTIIVGGCSVDQEALERAVELQVRGIISGGLASDVLPEAERAPLPIVVTEGVSVVPMCSPIYRLLEANDGREAVLSAQFQSLWGRVRPEVIVPLPAEPDAEEASGFFPPLEVGDTVRVTQPPRLGVVGTVAELSASVDVPTGDRLPAARVELEDEGSFLVPLANLEVMR